MKILLSEEQVHQGVREMADEIARQYGAHPLTILGVMTGSIMLLADLVRLLTMPLRIGVVQASSYRGGVAAGKLVINSEMAPDITDHDVLLVDDIFDTGHTLTTLVDRMHGLGARSVRTGVLLLKEGRQEVDYHPDYVAFQIQDEFVVGYGLDYQDEFRNLPFIGVLEPHDQRGATLRVARPDAEKL